ncbi:DNA primase [Aquibacillus koreensis]|uniref:DNA primase n=1 Tax=Aquibacillus koreensis TaxID=279446 RepID=A0A9X4AI57_9BACI|nr:DNA primase [Aquibacillus koreensis]MCT2537589.1 DNA primase [Aquibacillus koreensis]MDC3419035.1 DNA primase [Aquibacillus koreensis]
MPKQIPEELVEEIRKSNDIVDIIGEYVQLKKQGRNYFGLCPFHGENTPSFSVTQDKQIFHCFGCGKGGNVVTFVMEMEGYNFYQAINYLAGKSGHTLPDKAQSEGSFQSKETLDALSAYEWLTKLYHHLLRHTKEGKEGYQYLKDRGFTDDVIDTFQLGYSPNSKDFIVEFLEKKGFHRQSMVKAGILSSNEDNVVTDRFRGRVIFPIRNHLGKTIGFGGRTITDQKPKYLNSPESELFQKGKLLYNFDLARKSIRKKQEAVLFEGQMDVISAHKAGVMNGIATLGTALTDMQAKLLRRYVDTVIICYDPDNAGFLASFKAAKLLKQVGCAVKVATLPNGLDPDDYIKTYGADRFHHEVIEASDTYMTFMMKYLKKDYNLKLEGDRIQYVENVIDEIALIERPIEREHYLKELANEFELSIETLTQEVRSRNEKIGGKQDKPNQSSHTNKANSFKKTQKLRPAYYNAERQLLAYMLQDASIAEKVKVEVGGAFNVDEHKIIVTYLYGYYEEGYTPNVSQFIEKLPDSAIQSTVVQISMIPIHEDISDKEINDYIRMIRMEQNEKETIHSLKIEQRNAEMQNDPVRAAQIAMQILELKKQIKNSNH